MKRIISLLCIFVFTFSALAKGDKPLQYDIMGAGTGNEGFALVKVYVYGKNITDQELKRAAVHGVVFRGYSGNNSRVRQPAMTSPETEVSHSEFCKAFFSSTGECQNYANIIAGSYERIKMAKGMKFGAVIEVDKKALRKTLENAGVVRSLSAGF